MSKLLVNNFSSYELTPEEFLEGTRLNVFQKQCIQNLVYTAAQERLGLEVDTKDVNRFIQEEASLKGQIEILTFILDSAEEASNLEEDIK